MQIKSKWQKSMFKTYFYRELHLWQWIWRKWLFLWRFIPTNDNKVVRQWSLWPVHGNLWWYNTVWILLCWKHGNNMLCYPNRRKISLLFSKSNENIIFFSYKFHYLKLITRLDHCRFGVNYKTINQSHEYSISIIYLYSYREMKVIPGSQRNFTRWS